MYLPFLLTCICTRRNSAARPTAGLPGLLYLYMDKPVTRIIAERINRFRYIN